MYRATISSVVSAWTALELRNSETATHPNLLCMEASKGRALSLKIGREPSAECGICWGTTDRIHGPRAAENRRWSRFSTMRIYSNARAAAENCVEVDSLPCEFTPTLGLAARRDWRRIP